MRCNSIWTSRIFLFVALLSVSGACAAPVDSAPSVGDDSEALSDLDAIMDGSPSDRGASLPVDGKADEVLPSAFELMEYQSPVRSQGRRGTCTVFATIALMESLYLREGTLMNPDFSEQFLQWSVKTEVGAFRNTAGSNPNYNLQAINRFGIVEEASWPYESSQWGVSNDEACEGDDQPTRCYTNGEPPMDALDAQRFNLPRGRWINPRSASIRGHLVSTRTPVVVSGQFFYQSWSHGRSTLTTSSDYRAAGYVLSPNEEDVMDSSGDRRAGHGILLVGYDDTLAVARLDAEGNEVMDEEGNPVTETGFFLFKNSWGTGRFGTTNPHGAGYGWISYEYVEDHFTAYVAGLPEVSLTETCNDGRDNDRDGLVDCEDLEDCMSDRACLDPEDDYTNRSVVAIPDNDPSGVSTTVEVSEGGLISSLSVDVDITHTYQGDLNIRLVRESDGVEALLFDRQGGSADDLQQTFSVSDFNGTDAAGTYRLIVVDHAAQDTGSLNSWRLEITRCEGDCGGTSTSRTYTDEANTPIADDAELVRTLEVTDRGEIIDMQVAVDLDHTFPYELTIRFSREGGREFVLLTEDASSTDGVRRTFNVPGFVGEELEGTWRLTVVDAATGDTGTLNRWSIQAAVR